MSYIDAILEPGETIRYRTSISWIVYIPGVILIVLAIACYFAALHMMIDPLKLAGAAIAIVALAALARAWLRRMATEIVVTDRRVILKRGIIRRHTVEMNMQKIESVDVDQTLIGRLFDYGDVTVRGVGSSLEMLKGIDAPLKLRSTVTAG